ncbi:MAG: RNA polymerase sigma factor [Pseudomonadota bacterium]
MENSLEDEMLKHLPSLRAFALSLTRDRTQADDLVQDTILRAWGNRDQFKIGSNMRAWMFTILRNSFYTTRRRLKREVADVDGEIAAQLSVKPDHDGHIALEEFKDAFAQLRDEQREALLLVGVSGFSVEEAAEMCGCAPGTIKSRASRGRKKLAALLQLDDGEMPMMTDAATLGVVLSAPAV